VNLLPQCGQAISWWGNSESVIFSPDVSHAMSFLIKLLAEGDENILKIVANPRERPSFHRNTGMIPDIEETLSCHFSDSTGRIPSGIRILRLSAGLTSAHFLDSIDEISR
jgi:hypothetical protein